MSTTQTDTDRQQSFAETAMRLGGKSEEEARRMGAVDRADDQVEHMFAPQYQTVEQPRPQGRLGEARPHRAVHAAAAAGVGPVRRRDGALARGRPPSPRGRHRLRRAQQGLDDSARRPGRRPATGACSSTRSTAVRARRSQRFTRFLTRVAMQDATCAGLASVHGCIGAVDPVRTFGSAEQKARLLPDLASGESLSGFALTEPAAGSDLTALRTTRRPRRRPLRGDRREAVHHQRGAGPHHRPGRQDRRQAGRPHRRTAARGERAIPDGELRPVRPEAHLEPRPEVQPPAGAAREPAGAEAGRRPDHRLSRSEPGPAGAVRHCRRQHAGHAGQHPALGALPPHLRRSRSTRANWSSAASPAWPA